MRGYVYEYSRLFNCLANEVAEEVCAEVTDILNMYRKLGDAYRRLPEATGIDPKDITFIGFDGSGEEAEQYMYASFLKSEGRFHESEIVDSHFPRLTTYREMLREWKASSNPDELTKEDILRVIESGVCLHPR